MRFDPDKVLKNAVRADTGELLDRVTVLREGMEPEAIDIFTAELARRGVGPDELHAHERQLKHRVLRHPDGIVVACSFCSRAAVESWRDWHRLWGLVPIFKREFFYCDRHASGRRR